MPKILLTTKINASIERVFDLARDIDLHKKSTYKTNEEAVEGKTSGLIGLNETVTWRAKHLGVYQKMTVKITDLERPNFFTDVMLKGAFKSMKHTHRFRKDSSFTIMTDEFEFVSPLGIIGKAADCLFLKNYMRKFLIKRNNVLKEVAEIEKKREI